MHKAPRLITTGVIAKAVGTTPERVARLLRSRPYIEPAAYAGHVRLFMPEVIAQVRHEVNAIDARRAAGGR